MYPEVSMEQKKMKFNINAIKATLFTVLTAVSTSAFAGQNFDIKPVCTPTPPPHYDPTPFQGPHPAAVPEPSAWISFAIGTALIAGLSIYNRSKAAKATN